MILPGIMSFSCKLTFNHKILLYGICRITWRTSILKQKEYHKIWCFPGAMGHENLKAALDVIFNSILDEHLNHKIWHTEPWSLNGLQPRDVIFCIYDFKLKEAIMSKAPLPTWIWGYSNRVVCWPLLCYATEKKIHKSSFSWMITRMLIDGAFPFVTVVHKIGILSTLCIFEYLPSFYEVLCIQVLLIYCTLLYCCVVPFALIDF